MATTPFSVCKEFCAGGGGASNAKDVKYDNKKSGLAADNVGDAIDELYTNMGDIDTSKNWNQNDPKEADYIENRPFYEDGAKVKQLEDKFIPNTIARTEDVDKKMEDAEANVDAKIIDASIKPTANGSLHALSDSAEAPLQGMRIFGKTKQATTTGKNKCPNTATTKTVNGVTFTVNKDKSVTVSGTATADTRFDLYESETGISAGSYIMSGGISVNAYIAILSFNGSSLGINSNVGTDNNLTITEEQTAKGVSIRLMIKAGTTANGTFFPMIRDATITDNTYEPYTGGMPSPSSSYKQDMKNDGDKGSIELFVKGKNWCDNSRLLRKDNNGDATRVQSGYCVPVARNTDYIISAINVTTQPLYGIRGVTKEEFVETLNWDVAWRIGTQIIGNSKASFNTGEYDYIVFRTWAENSTYGITDDTKFQLEVGTVATPYEPYKSQSLTIPTPNGLPGIPVSSGGNYTDENGQQYASDYKDYERMVYVQRVGEWIYTGGDVRINTCTVYERGDSLYWNVQIPGVKNVDTGIGTALSNVFLSRRSVYANPGYIMVTSAKNYLYMSLKASDFGFVYGDGRNSEYKPAITSWMQTTFSEENPLIVLYELETPIETPLSEEEIEAYKALHTNYPNTTIYNDEGAYTEVKYVADTKNYVDNKIANEVAKLTAAIITE